jgi:L-ascorbate metabolism protein UlaG (beta-lactamase superfamily)
MTISSLENQYPKQAEIKFIHIRHATSIIEINNRKFLIDPMLSDKERMPPVLLTNNKLKNPLVALPFNIEYILQNTGFVLLTHLHFDHFDRKAIKNSPKTTAFLCSKNDSKKLNRLGFSLTQPIDYTIEIEGINITQFSSVHGKGLLKYLMGKGSSYLINYKGFKLFLTGDCILTNSLRNNLIEAKPDIIIANAGAAKFKFGKPITMSIKDIIEISKILKNSRILVLHLDALNHCTETRDYSKEQIRDYSNIYIPEDGEEVEIK